MRIWDRLDNMEAKLEGYFPYTPTAIVYRHLNKHAVNILDLGCGKGDPMLFINRSKKYYTVGVDAFPEYLQMCKLKNSHNRYIQGDILEQMFSQNTYDIVLGLRILEHFTKEDGIKLLDKMESTARKQVIIVTPVEDFKQTKYDNNRFQEHKYIWTPQELKDRGYKIYLNGFKGIQKDSATVSHAMKRVAIVGHVVWGIFGWLPMFIPSIAANMVAVKDL